MKKQKSYFSIFIVVSVFLFLKLFQLVNSFVLVELFFRGEGFSMLVGMISFIIIILFLGLLAQKFFPVFLNYIFLVIFSVLAVASLVNFFWLLVFLAGLFWYGVISAEEQVFRSLADFRQMPRYLLAFFGFIFLFIAHKIPQQTHPIVAQALFIGSSILSLIISYSPKMNEGKTVVYEKAPSFFIGLIFILGSAFSYYLIILHGNLETVAYPLLVSSLLFYLIGSFIINLSLDGYIRKIAKRQNLTRNVSSV